MSVIQPQSPPKPKSTLRTRVSAEWEHLDEMPLLQFYLLALLTIVVIPFSPLLPLSAYLLQLWAGLSWRWRDRWTSVWIWARKGAWIMGSLIAIMALAIAHVWIFPALIVLMQAFWLDHLPGSLSLSPLDGHALLARMLLLSPLTPLLTLLYERINPRTAIRLPRVLLPADLAPQPAQKDATAPPPEPEATLSPAAPPPSESDATTPPTATPTASEPPTNIPELPTTLTVKRRATRQRTQAKLPPEQMTIDSLLAPQTPTSTTPADGRQHVPQEKTEPPKTEAIDWDDVAE